MANDLSAQLQAKFNASAPEKEPERDTLGQLLALINKVTGTEVPRVPDTTSETAPSATTEEPAPSTDVTPEVTAPTTTTTTPVPTA